MFTFSYNFFFSVLPWYKISSLGSRNSAGNFSPPATVATGETLILHVFPEVLFHHYWPNFFRPYCFTTVDPSGGEKYYIATNMCKTAKSVSLTPFQSNSTIQTDVIGRRIDVLFFFNIFFCNWMVLYKWIFKFLCFYKMEKCENNRWFEIIFE